jgi:lysophospholipase L1-like esterase
MDRRNFFRKTAIVSGSVLLIPGIVNAAIPGKMLSENRDKYSFSYGDTILFQGDSITDWKRKRREKNKANDQSQLGLGYTLFTAASILANHAGKNLKIYNRGIAGNKVFQLSNRWDEDCIDLHPNLVSILVGVNDFWHTKTHTYKGLVATYEADYRELLERTKKDLPGTKIVICEPFIIHGGSALDDSWEPHFTAYRKVTQRLALDFELMFVPFQSVFNEALKKAPVSYWGQDGIHPSMAGAQLMAQAWLKAVL